MLMGTIDCITTAIGLHYFGAVELSPIMAGIVHNIPLTTHKTRPHGAFGMVISA